MSNYQANVSTKINFGQLDKLESRLEKVKVTTIDVNIKSSGLDTLLSQLKEVQTLTRSLGKTGSASAGASKSSGSYTTQINQMKQAVQLEEKLKLLRARTQSGNTGQFNTKEITNYLAKITDVENKVKSLHNSGKSGIELDAELKNASVAARQLESELNGVLKPINSMKALTASNQMTAWLKSNSKASKELGQQIQTVASQMKQLAFKGGTQGDFDALQNQFRNITSIAKATGQVGISWKDNLTRGFKQITRFVGVYGILQRGVQVAGQMASAVIEVDSAMTELRKVSDAPANDITNYFDQATVSAKKYGATISDVISSTADWSRLGFNLKDASQLSDATTLLQKVGDNMTQESSSEGLISILKGFNLEADNVNSIIDSVNEVANKEPIDTAGIVSALQRSASSLSAAGNDMNQSIAMVTAANSVVQDPDAVGTAFKTMSMRIRGAKTELEAAGEDTEGMATSTAKLQAQMEGLAGVDIMKDKNTFKSTYQILGDLANKWKDMTDIQQADICLVA